MRPRRSGLKSIYFRSVPIQRPLTPRQHLILRGVARGKTNKDIASELGISEQGVKVHISRLLERYGAENRVELVNLTRAWPVEDDRTYAELSSDIAGIRAGLNTTHRETNAFANSRGGRGRSAAPTTTLGTNSHTPGKPIDLGTEVRSLREVLSEINVALKLARELPADANVGPIVDAIRARVGAALEESARLDALIDDRRSLEDRPKETAN
jgi:DNA-binding CsgD family transcriptional regulator